MHVLKMMSRQLFAEIVISKLNDHVAANKEIRTFIYKT